MAAQALAATHAAGLKSNVVFVPRPSASPAQVAKAAATGTVSPLYTGVPAPIGLAYYGLSGSGESPPVGSILNTTAVRGYVDANATGIQGMDLFQSSPDSYGIQLNSVMTNVTLFGTGGYSFWTQDVVEYYPATDFMVLVTNIWNFSSGPYHGNEFYSQSVVPGAVDDYGLYGVLGYYYAEYVVPHPVFYPFNLTLTMGSGINGGQDNMSFSVALSSSLYPHEGFTLPSWDEITFNSTAIGKTPSQTIPSNYTANGLQYNPIGLTDDFELDVCGPGGGSQVDLSAADATLGLAYLSSGNFVSVPAAYNYGGETGETATGANVAWSDAPGGPATLADYGTMTTGSTQLNGLWGTGAPEGSFPVTISVTPANAFNFLQYNGSATFTNPVISELSYAPSMLTSTFYLTPGTYGLVTELSDFSPFLQTITVSGPTTVTVALTSDPSAGVYTPLWAFSNAELAALAVSGAGTPSSPYMMPNTQTGAFSSIFGLYNDYTFPVFPGVFFFGTTASVELYKPPSFAASTNTFQFPGTHLPATNDLQYWFWGVSDVSLVDAHNISGWFGATTFYPISFDTFNVIFYASSYNLVAGNTFHTEAEALLLFSSGTLFGPEFNGAGGNNTVWGNTFLTVPSPSTCPATCEAFFNEVFSVGIEIAEFDDLVYNNYVVTPTTAWLLPLNMYSGYPMDITGTMWNITPEAASVVNYAAGFPTIPLTGSIVGGTVQGGNFWWDYGVVFNPYNGADNPFGVLPYDENAQTLIVYIYGPSYYYQTYIYNGGDYAPLTLTAGPAVTFAEKGLAEGVTWGATITVGVLEYGFTTNSPRVTLTAFPAGRYPYAAMSPPPTGYTAVGGGTFTLTTHPITVAVKYHLNSGYSVVTFHESGLPSGTLWSVSIIGTTIPTDAYNATESSTGTSIQFVVINGDYNYFAHGAPAGWVPVSPAGSLTVMGPTSAHIKYVAHTWGLTFLESGIPFGLHWKVTISGPISGHGTQRKSASSIIDAIYFSVANGTYSFTITAPANTVCSASPSGSVVVDSSFPPGTTYVIVTCVYTAPAGSSSGPATSINAPAPAAMPVELRGTSA